MLKLCGGCPISRAYRPAILFVALGVSGAGVNHRFDRKTHTGFKSIDPALAVGKVRDGGIKVKFLPKAVSHILPHHTESSTMSFRHNRLSNFADLTTWGQCVESQIKTIKRALRDTAAFFGDFADQKRFTLVSVPPINNRGDVHVDDVTVTQDIAIRDPVTNNFVDACAATLGVIL